MCMPNLRHSSAAELRRDAALRGHVATILAKPDWKIGAKTVNSILKKST